MSAVGYVERLREEQPARRGLSVHARGFLFATVAATVVATALASSLVTREPARWLDFGLIAFGAALAQLFATPVGGNQGFHTGLAFTVTAALLLPPELVVAVCVLQHVPDWIRHRYRWYVQTFNAANYALAGLAAWAVRTGFAHGGIDAATRTSVTTVLATVAAAAAFVAVNHVLLAEMLRLARGRDARSSGLFGLESLATDMVLAATGILIAFGLLREHALAAVAVVPLFLIHRALVVPSLREQAFRDHKTGLLNERGFERAADDEFARAKRFGRPLAVLLCDVDELRTINNTYGHLKGDAALGAVADAFRAELRSFDLCARFGGDEFLVLLPETDREEALVVADRIRAWVGRNPVWTGSGPLAPGLSIGAAVLEPEDERLSEVIARADAAMYAAKEGAHGVLSVAG
jgi:diguanylate cyclase (GGDEF)-like protein